MPWRRKGKCVFKINKDKTIGKKQGCSDSTTKAKKYLKALYANVDEMKDQVKAFVDQYLEESEYSNWFDGLDISEVLDESQSPVWEVNHDNRTNNNSADGNMSDVDQ
jgi:hypothetical protein